MGRGRAGGTFQGRRLLSILNKQKLERVLGYLLDENEFLGPHGIRSLSRYHLDHPFVFHVGGQEYKVQFLPAESNTGMFGGNSNWRGPVWMPVNTLIVRALMNLYAFYGDEFKVECPTGSGRHMTLFGVLENHDEPRAAATFSPRVHEAAAVITFLSPGLRFFHQGQFEGRRKRISPHLVRGPDEPIDERLKEFYGMLLAVLRRPPVREGQWQLLDCIPAWDGNWTHDCFLAFVWQRPGAERLLAAVNYAPNQGQCHVRLPFTDLGNGQWRLQDLLGSARYDRAGDELRSRGLYLDVPPWQCHAFSMTKLP